MIILRATLDSVRMKSGEWKIVLNVPQTETELVAAMVNTCQEVLLNVSIEQMVAPAIGTRA